MNLNEIMNYVNIAILGICLCVGYMLKNAVPTTNINRYIPLIMGFLGMILAIVSNMREMSLEVVLMGLMSGLASTGLYETFRNLINKESE
ncbi:MAG: holin [Bacilli bacterium]|nr:holin [Bacilli bacterium]